MLLPSASLQSAVKKSLCDPFREMLSLTNFLSIIFPRICAEFPKNGYVWRYYYMNIVSSCKNSQQ